MVPPKADGPYGPVDGPPTGALPGQELVRTKRLLREFDDCREVRHGAEADCSMCSSMMIRRYLAPIWAARIP